MLKKISNYIYFSIFISIMFMIFSIVCIVKPDMSFTILSWILIGIFIVNGVVSLILDYKQSSIFINHFLHGTISLVIGIILLIHPDALKILLPFVVGIWFMISGLFNFKFSTYLKKESPGFMILSMITAMISIICGIVLIARPLETVTIVTVTLGITCLIYSVSNTIDMIVIKKYMDKITKNIKSYVTQFIDL